MRSVENLPEAEIREQLNRILSSSAFKNSRVLSGFLKFVVDSTLAGKEMEIKEYSIGIQVLSRNIDFNPQLDSIVRIHAGRLRRALKEYYYEAGMNDPIRIDIPKGSYVPVFLIQSAHSDSENKETTVQETIKGTTKNRLSPCYPFGISVRILPAISLP